MVSTQSKKSPYTILWEHLANKNKEPISDDVLKICSKYLLLNICKNQKVCLFLNKYFNNINIHCLDNNDIFNLLQLLFNKFNLTKNDILYIPFNKIEKNEILNKVKHKFPFLKKDELSYLIDNNKDNEDFIELLYAVGHLEENNKKELKERSKQRKEEIKSEKKEKKNKKENDILFNDNINQPITNKLINNKCIFNLPEKYNNDDYQLVDIHISQNKPLYIFRNKQTNKKETYLFNDYDNYFYYRNTSTNIIANISESQLIKCNNKDNKKQFQQEELYEADLNMENKHIIEFYYNNPNNNYITPQIMFMDIEVFRNGFEGFPDPKKAAFPINAISYYMNDQMYVELLMEDINLKKKYNDIYNNPKNIFNYLDSDTQELDIFKDNLNIRIFDNEKDLILGFINNIHNLDPDVITAWNLPFDITYLYNRCKQYKLNPNMISKTNDGYIDSTKEIMSLPGYILIDMLEIYKGFTSSIKESYKLSNIAKDELKDDKIQFEGNLDKLYYDNIIKFVLYNIKDTHLIYRLNKKLNHINLINIMRQITKSSWYSVSSNTLMIDSLIISELKKRGQCVRNSVDTYIKQNEDVTIEGGYVKTPIGGIYNNVVDFDFASLYPNLIRQYNIGPDTFMYRINKDIAFDYLYNRDEFINKYNNIEIIKNVMNLETKENININDFLNIADNHIVLINGTIFKKHNEKVTILHDILCGLLDNRTLYKNKMKDAIKEKNIILRETYNNYQSSFKVLANSLYGALAFKHIRYFNPYIADAITGSGREAIKWSAIQADEYVKKELNEPYTDDIITKFRNDYVANDISTKYVIYVDTDSLFIKLNELILHNNISKENKTDYILKDIVPKLQTYLNIDGITNLLKNHNIDNPDKLYLNLKQEVIAESAYFLHEIKKKYALYIINKEGIPVNEEEIKGLEIKRSDFPRISRNKLEELLKIILYSETFDIMKISKFIHSTENEIKTLINNHSINISKPVSFSKDIEEYKNSPQHIKGMIWWNKLEYNHFMHGTKGYLFNILGIDYELVKDKQKEALLRENFNNANNGKLDVIVIPQELEFLPEYYILDKKKTLDFAWTKRVENLVGDILLIETKKENKRNVITF